MNGWETAAIGGAFWYGILTAVSPCLLATTVTAISYIARRVDKPKYVLLSGLSYTCAQALTYVILAMIIVQGLLSIPAVATALRTHILDLIGPLLIVTAVFLLELIQPRPGAGRLKKWAQAHADGGGIWFAALLGILFALSFCPTTAALFFSGLIPLALAQESPLLLPLAYALGVALPVCLFGLIIALAANQVGRAYKRVAHMEKHARRVTGIIFLAVGIYFTLKFTLAP